MPFPQRHSVCSIPVIALLAVLLGACSSTPPAGQVAPAEPSPADFPEAYYRQATADGKKVLRIDPSASLVTVKVRRGGRLARLGHDHVVASRDVQGYVAPDEGRADLYVPLAKLTVDETALRNEAGLDTQPAPEAIEGTRNNMLGKVLEADRFPYALISVIRADPARPDLRVAITLHGVTREYTIPAQIESLPNGISVSGGITLNQTDFGIVPMSVLGGAILVLDQLELQFRIVAGEPR